MKARASLKGTFLHSESAHFYVRHKSIKLAHMASRLWWIKGKNHKLGGGWRSCWRLASNKERDANRAEIRPKLPKNSTAGCFAEGTSRAPEATHPCSTELGVTKEPRQTAMTLSCLGTVGIMKNVVWVCRLMTAELGARTWM